MAGSGDLSGPLVSGDRTGTLDATRRIPSPPYLYCADGGPRAGIAGKMAALIGGWQQMGSEVTFKFTLVTILPAGCLNHCERKASFPKSRTSPKLVTTVHACHSSGEQLFSVLDNKCSQTIRDFQWRFDYCHMSALGMKTDVELLCMHAGRSAAYSLDSSRVAVVSIASQQWQYL
ncbi:hypothetical protein BaRGS_00015260 [Batillaria attramentaria]|uniref:Uncharacterized protein n=1 Tax=Batillaria attramentaria TaxID=370345 RepID=A0ABD0L2B0_9CAEN